MSTSRSSSSRAAAAPAAGQDGSSEIEKELSFYAAYHNNPINKLIHIVCVPMIAWTTLIFAAYLTLPGSHTTVLAPGLAYAPNLALIGVAGYQLYYLKLDFAGGLSMLPLNALLYLTATYCRAVPSALPYPAHATSAVPFTTALFVFSWVAQFVGHGVFEGRAPALLTNLTQALVLAPFFVHLEVLYSLFGYKSDLHKRVKNKAGMRIRDMNKAKKAQ